MPDVNRVSNLNLINEKEAELSELLLEEVRYLARHALQVHSNLDEFIMGMGLIYFTTKDGGNIDIHERVYLKRLYDLLDNFNSDFSLNMKITGYAMRFRHGGPEINYW